MTPCRRLRFIVLAILLLGIAALLFYTPDKPKFSEVSRETAQRSASSYRADTAKTPPIAEEQFVSTPAKSRLAALPPSMRPQGKWAASIPSPEMYIEVIAPKQFATFRDFRMRYPALDPTDVDLFYQAIDEERAKYPATLDDDSANRYNAWLIEAEAMQAAAVAARAQLIGIPYTGNTPDDRGFILEGFSGTTPHYIFGQNVAAAVTTGVNLVRQVAAYDTALAESANGSGVYVNINDTGTIYEHPEFQLPNNGGSRVMYTEVNDAGSRNHATHVTGTVAAYGYNSEIIGMAPRAWIRAHIQLVNSDITAFGARWPGQWLDGTTVNPRNNQLQLRSVTGAAPLGSGTLDNCVYGSAARANDTALRDAPYFSQFYSADNLGATGYLTLGSGVPMSKNAFIMGSVSDMVRDSAGGYVSGGDVSSFSSRGPTFDGRIKPDFTANGESLLSAWGTSSTGRSSGTSMATPNAAGSAALLIDYINKKMPGHYFRSSTIKAILVNRATDRGNPGPDYQYGWGVINIKAAADMVKRYAENPINRMIVEDTLQPGQVWTQNYVKLGNNAARLTLAWNDPAGATQSSTTTDRSPRLVNNLNVRLIASDGTIHLPYVMPYTTGNGSFAAFNSNLYTANAVPGDNVRDNVEQIFVNVLPAGTYTVQVSHTGSLQGEQPQPFSIALTNLDANAPLTHTLTAVSPESVAAVSDAELILQGSGFMLGTNVFLRRIAANGTTEQVQAYGVIPASNRISCRIDARNLAKGYWDVMVRQPNGAEVMLSDAFFIRQTGGGGARVDIYRDDFEDGATGLTLESGWAVAVPNKASLGGPATAQQGTRALVTYPGANYPAGVGPWVTFPSINTTEYSDIRLEFQRWLGVRSGDSGRMRYSVNGSFFLTEIAQHSNLIDTAWSAQTYNLQSNAAGIESVVINIEMNSDSTDHSFGWNIDDLKLTGIANFGIPPRVTSAAPAAALQGQQYSQTIATVDADTAGSTLAFTAIGLPTGITLTPNGSGGATLSGTSMTAGTSTFLLSVSDGTYTTRKSYSLVTTAQTAPSTPTGLSASAVSATALSLSWNDVSNDETGYVVERSTTSGSGFTNIANLAAGASSYSDTLQPLGTTYFYRVMAVKGALTSAYSNETSATTWSLLQQWRADNNLPVAGTGSGANLVDPDSDGIENLLEYAFGSNPISSTGDLAYSAEGAVTAAGKPIARNLAVGSGEEYHAIFTRRKDRVAAGLTYTVQFSAGLDIWVNNTEPPTVLTGAGGENPAAVEAVSVPYPLLIPVNGGSKKPTFFRVVVTLNP